jgi:tRNA A-37 threonylcarbamoyl transferase component Bud32
MSLIGKTLDHYRILAQIGEGGMGVVYRARDEVLNRDVALKLLAHGAIDRVGPDHLLREAQTASSLSHPNICTIHQVGQSGEDFYVVMELVEGRSLSDLISNTGLTMETVTRYGTQIADALAHAHDRGIVHRDLKGSNVMVTPEGRVKVLDFGLATRLERQEISDLTISYSSLESKMVGTLPYMAPEVLKGQKADHLSDVWALGVLLYEAAAGQLPFRGKTGFEVTSAILREPLPALPASVPYGLAAIIQHCLMKAPTDRYQRASEVRVALEAVQGAVLQTRHPSEETRGPRMLVLRGIEHLAVRNRDVLLLVGTNKGAFLVRSSRERAKWDVAGPYFHGQGVYAVAYDGRNGRRRLWVSTNNMMWGTFLRSSDDFGRSWTNPLEANIRFPAESGTALRNIWQICMGRPDEPDKMYCGAEPAALFESCNEGGTWSLVRGLYDHPHRPRWMPSNGGLTLHTILPDPANRQRMYTGVSAGGVYRTDDGGISWQPHNKGIRVTFMPERYPEFGQCVHKIVMHQTRPERLFLQNHGGFYRSEDGGDSWQEIGHDLPSDFGFAVLMHPHDADCVYTVPVESEEFRCTPEGRLRVYRTRNAGRSWEPLGRGLPENGAFETVLRDAMTTDCLDPAGIYFGTRSGKLYGTRDDGRSWKKLVEGLPQVLCVRAAYVEMDGLCSGGTRAAPAKPVKRKKAAKSAKRRKAR